MNDRIESIMDVADVALDSADVFNSFRDLCFEFDLEQLALAIFTEKKVIKKSFVLYDTYPKEWAHRYQRKRYQEYDPVFRSLRKVATPITWNMSSFENLLPHQQVFLDESRDFGVSSGITIPLIPFPAFHGFVTLLNKSCLHPHVLYSLSLAANATVNKIMIIQERDRLKKAPS